MSLLEFAERTSPVALTPHQREYLVMYERVVNENRELTCCFGRDNGRTMVKNIVNEFYGKSVII